MNLRSWLNDQRRTGISLSIPEGNGDRLRLPDNEEECVLVSAARQGSREAFDLLIQGQLPTLYRFLAGRLGSRDAVEDIVQETLLGAWTALPGFEPRVRFRTWLLRIASNKTADYLRSAVRRDRYEEPLESEPAVTSSENLEAATERRGIIRQALSQLSGPQREVIEMYYYAELTLPEISRLTGRNLNTVKYQFYAAHTAAAAALKEENDDFSTNIGAASAGTGGRPATRAERLVGPARYLYGICKSDPEGRAMSEYPCGGAQREQQLMLYVGGELPLWERLRIESHLRNCPLCREQQRFLLNTMQIVAAEVRGGAMPLWEAQGMLVSTSALSGRFHGKPVGSVRLVTLAAISAAVAILTSYVAATYGDRLLQSHSAPLSRVSIAASPPCESTPIVKAGQVLKPAKSCHNCASPVPPVISK